MRKNIYLLTVKCSYQNINYKRGKRMVSKNRSYININNCFTENTVNNMQNCSRCIDRIRFEISKKSKKELEITILEIIDSKFISESNDIY